MPLYVQNSIPVLKDGLSTLYDVILGLCVDTPTPPHPPTHTGQYRPRQASFYIRSVVCTYISLTHTLLDPRLNVQ